jgi:metallo-beta-lactamase family protein
MPTISHHGAIDGVTGSCHRLTLADGRSVLVDCGMFQGAETSSDGAGSGQLEITFPLEGVQALVSYVPSLHSL